MVRPRKQAGFTLIEMIVSLALFAGVVTIAVGALLVLVAANDQLQGEQSVTTNLAFALDSMTREIRTGTDYYCNSRSNYTAAGSDNLFNDSNNIDTIINGLPAATDFTEDCDGIFNAAWQLHGLAFLEGGDSITGANQRILYFHDRDSGEILRRIGGEPAVSIVSSDIFIHDFQVFVTGSTPLSRAAGSFQDQATVTLYLEAGPTSTTPVAERYKLQATVAQRTLDL